MFLLCVFDSRAEGREAKASELEALFSEGDTDDRDAKDYAYEEESERLAEAAEEQPEEVSKRVRAEVGIDRLAERPEHKFGELEELFSEGDTDDRNAKDHAYEEVSDSGPKTDKNKPNDIAECFHNFPILFK